MPRRDRTKANAVANAQRETDRVRTSMQIFSLRAALQGLDAQLAKLDATAARGARRDAMDKWLWLVGAHLQEASTVLWAIFDAPRRAERRKRRSRKKAK